MSNNVNKNQSLLSMMSPQAQKQVLLLIKRLGDQKQSKQQYQKKCLIYEEQIIQLKKQVQGLRKQNFHFKQKLQNSFSLISKARQTFSGSKKSLEQHLKNASTIKKLKFNKDQADWTQQSEQQEVQQQDNNHFKHKTQKTKNPNLNNTKKQQNQSQTTNPILQTIQNPNKQQKQQKFIQNFPPMTNRKQKRNFSSTSNQKLNITLSQSKLNISSSSSKKQQIQGLKYEIQQLTEQIKNKQTKNLTLNQKVKKCQEIKNRYKRNHQTNDNIIEQNQHNHSVVQQYYTSNDHNSSIIQNQQNTNTNRSNYTTSNYPNTNTNSNTNININTNTYRQNYKNKQDYLNRQNDRYKQNSKRQTQSCLSQSMIQNETKRLNKEVNQVQQIKQSLFSQKVKTSKQNISCNGVSVSNKQKRSIQAKPEKSISKPLKPSFYDDDLLNLIDQMNP